MHIHIIAMNCTLGETHAINEKEFEARWQKVDLLFWVFLGITRREEAILARLSFQASVMLAARP